MRHGVNNPEHVADHMYMMAMMAFFIQDDHNLNKERYGLLLEYLGILRKYLKYYNNYTYMQFRIQLRITDIHVHNILQTFCRPFP